MKINQVKMFDEKEKKNADLFQKYNCWSVDFALNKKERQ